MKIPDGRVKEPAAEEAEHRVAEIAMQRRHRPRGDATGKAVTHDQLPALPQAGQKFVQRTEIVAAVAVAHDDETSARSRNATDQGRAVTFRGDGHHPRPERRGDIRRTVVAAVVGNQHLADDTGALQEGLGLLDAGGESARLVQTGHEDRQLRHLVQSCPA